MSSGIDKQTLLIVDDAAFNLVLLVKAMRGKGYRVCVAQNGEEAFSKALQVHPDLILLDVMLPGEDGYEICQRFKSAPETHDIPVIFMTAQTSSDHKVKGFAAGGVDYITKPLNLEEVLSRVSVQLELVATRRDLEVRNAQLEAYRLELEQRVDERTAELSASNRLLQAEVERRRAAEATLALKSFALDRVHEAAFLVDEAGLLHYVNKEACSRLGYSKSELIGMKLGVIDQDWATGSQTEDRSKHWTALKAKGGMTFDTRYLTRSGESFAVEVTANYFEYGGSGYILCLGRDITERKRVMEALKQALTFTQGVIDAIPDILFEVDHQGCYLNVWTHRPELLAAQREHLLGRTIFEVLDPQAAAVAKSAIAEADSNGVSFGKIIRIEFPDGERWFELSISRKPDAEPANPHYLVLSRDITERIGAEAELRRYREHLEELVSERTTALQRALGFAEGIINAIPDLLFELDQEGRYQNIWTHAPERLAAQRDELLGRTVSEALAPEAAATVMEALAEAQTNEHSISFGKKIQIDLPAGPAWFELSVSSRPGGAPGDARFLVLSRDVSEQVRSEEEIRRVNADLEQRVRERTKQLEVANKELRISELEYRSLAENIPDNLIRYDSTGKTVYCNPNCERSLLQPIGKALGKLPCDLFPDNEEVADYQAAVQRVIASGCPEQMVFELAGPGGDRQVHQVSFVAEQGSNGEILGALAIGRDVTALVVAEQRVLESHAKLRELLTRREAERNDERRRMAREMHDELGQVLTALKLGIATLRMQFRDVCQTFDVKTASLLDLVDQAIHTVRAVATSLRPAALDMGLLPALQWLVDEFKRHSSASCHLQLPEETCEIDELRAMTVFRTVQEALTNAARHADANEVGIDLRRDTDGACLLEIQDDGRGFDPESAPGHLGLLGMRERIDSVGGTLSIDSVPGVGTCIRARIPDLDAVEVCER